GGLSCEEADAIPIAVSGTRERTGEAAAEPSSSTVCASDSANPRPQCPQNRVLSGLTVLHLGHTIRVATCGPEPHTFDISPLSFSVPDHAIVSLGVLLACASACPVQKYIHQRGVTIQRRCDRDPQFRMSVRNIADETRQVALEV